MDRTYFALLSQGDKVEKGNQKLRGNCSGLQTTLLNLTHWDPRGVVLRCLTQDFFTR